MSERTRFGDFMYNLITPAAIFVGRHKWLFYILTYTWALLNTIIGYVMFYFVRIFLSKKITSKGKFETARYLMFGNCWGGVACGKNFMIADKMGSDYTFHCMKHELGHTYQNAVMGPFAIFFGYIPSVIRYWHMRAHPTILFYYDGFWYEGSATEIGNKIVKKGER